MLIFLKDVRIECRSRYALNASFLFSVTTLTVASFSLGSARLKPQVYAALLWVIVLFSAMSGLSRSFVNEEETGTSPTLRLAAAPIGIFLGKLLFNIALALALAIVVLPLFLAMMNCSAGNVAMLVAVVASAIVGLSVVCTMTAALIARAGVGVSLFAVLAFPALLPHAVAAVAGINAALASEPWRQAFPLLRMLNIYSVLMLTVSLLLFEHLWKD